MTCQRLARTLLLTVWLEAVGTCGMLLTDSRHNSPPHPTPPSTTAPHLHLCAPRRCRLGGRRCCRGRPLYPVRRQRLAHLPGSLWGRCAVQNGRCYVHGGRCGRQCPTQSPLSLQESSPLGSQVVQALFIHTASVTASHGGGPWAAWRVHSRCCRKCRGHWICRGRRRSIHGHWRCWRRRWHVLQLHRGTRRPVNCLLPRRLARRLWQLLTLLALLSHRPLLWL